MELVEDALMHTSIFLAKQFAFQDVELMNKLILLMESVFVVVDFIIFKEDVDFAMIIKFILKNISLVFQDVQLIKYGSIIRALVYLDIA